LLGNHPLNLQSVAAADLVVDVLAAGVARAGHDQVVVLEVELALVAGLDLAADPRAAPGDN
jgi:hypothetical protein